MTPGRAIRQARAVTAGATDRRAGGTGPAGTGGGRGDPAQAGQRSATAVRLRATDVAETGAGSGDARRLASAIGAGAATTRSTDARTTCTSCGDAGRTARRPVPTPGVVHAAIGHGGVTEDGVDQIGRGGEGCPGKVGIDQAGAAEIGDGEAGSPGVDAPEVGPGDLTAGAIEAGEGGGSSQVTLSQIGADARIARSGSPAPASAVPFPAFVAVLALVLAMGNSLQWQEESDEQTTKSHATRTELPSKLIEASAVHANPLHAFSCCHKAVRLVRV